MTPRVRKADSLYQPVDGYPDLELNTKSGTFYIRKTIPGHGEVFRSTRQRTKSKAQTAADEIEEEIKNQIKARKHGLRPDRITIGELCDLVLVDLEEQTRSRDEHGHLLRRVSTYQSKDLPFLRGASTRLKKERKGLRKQGVIRDLFGDKFADEIDEQFWKTWLKRQGRKLTRRKDDIAKYLSLVMSYAFDEKYISRKPEFKLPDAYRKHQRKAVIFTDDQVVAFFKHARPELQDLIVIGSENPLRPHENYDIHWSMVKIHRGPKGKPIRDAQGAPVIDYVLPEWFVKKNARTVRLTPNAAQVVLRRFHKNQKLPPAKQSPFVFPSPSDPQRPIGRVRVNRWWRQMKKAAKISPDTKLHFHWFRHNVYRRLLKLHGVPIASVSQVGGTSIATLQKHYEMEEEQAQIQVASAIRIPFSGAESRAEEE